MRIAILLCFLAAACSGDKKSDPSPTAPTDTVDKADKPANAKDHATAKDHANKSTKPADKASDKDGTTAKSRPKPKPTPIPKALWRIATKCGGAVYENPQDKAYYY